MHILSSSSIDGPLNSLETLPVAPRAPTTPLNLAEVSRHFSIYGSFVSGEPHGTGHINDTYAVTCEERGRRRRYILQRINHRVFGDVPALMDNIQRVTQHAAVRLAEPRRNRGRGTPDAHHRAHARWGGVSPRDGSGSYWRCYDFVERARTYDIVQSPAQAREAACAFGIFQGLLADLDGPRLHETIPIFTTRAGALICFAAPSRRIAMAGPPRREKRLPSR